MGSRDRDSKSLQDKLKVFFKKGGSAPQPARNELVVTAELERELCADAPLHRRLRALKELGEKAISVRVQEGGVEKLWSCTRDLLEDSNTEARHAALCFLRCIASGQADYLQIMRTIFFRYLKETHAAHPAEDSQLRFKLLHTLTNSGKNINCFEEEIGPFLLEWLPLIQTPAHTVEFLQLIINVVKFNATYLDEHIVHGIVNNACQLCAYSAEAGVVSQALSLLEAVVSYSLLPRAALPTFVAALCRTVNVECHCQASWKLMRCVVGGDIGHAALQEMVSLLVGAGGSESEPEPETQAGVARGAVFYMNMALWGPRRVPTLRVSFLAVLPALLKALERRRPVLTYEVAVGVYSVVTRAPQDLHEPAWDVLLNILRTIVDHDKSFEPPNELIHSRLHAVITSIEQLHDAGQYYGDVDALLDLIDYCGHDRPESSTMRLVRLRAAALSPRGPEWASGALALADRYLRHDKRINVRLHTLTHILDFIHRYRWAYGEELAEAVGVPVLGACALDAEPLLRAAAASRLPALARHAPDCCTDLVDLLEKILNRPFEMYVTDVPIPLEADTSDLRLAVSGLLEMFHERLLASPGSHATRCFLVLLDHLDNHYKRPALFMHHPDIRMKIFELLFGLRVNAFNCVGYCYDAHGSPAVGVASAARLKPVCSPFLVAEPLAVRGQAPAPRELPAGACGAAAGRAARAVSAALTREADWSVLAAVLRALPPLLHTRALALGRRAADIDLLASTLCSMISDRSLNFPECLRVANGQKLLVSEFHAAALPALAALAPYHSYLEPQTQQRIVRCLLKYGMVLRTPQPYINALTIFTLETRETMVKMLPEVLLDLSKISDTKAIASPMLEFLSTLTRLPKVFASFVEDQYMSVFAILLPYTNPSRYNHYVVSLAHHVIAAWFLKCRLSYRRNFVRFIIHGLHNYIIMPFEEQLQYNSNNFQQPNANEDSSNRQRSSSLGSRAVSRAPLGRSNGGSSAASAASAASASAAFHVELTETCVDLLARYTSTPCSVKPHRSDTAEFLFNGGQSMTWLVGHKLVTITTSGCLQNSIKQGLCDRCAVLCKLHADSVASPLPPIPQPHEPAPNHHNHIDAATQVHINETPNDSQPLASTNSSHLQVQPAQNPPEVKRQNSSENNKTNDPLVEVLNQFSQRFERISKEVDCEEPGWSRVGEAASLGACPCWCSRWAEVHVRSPTGDVCFVTRVQNQMNWDYLLESPLQDVAAILNPVGAMNGAPPSTPAPAPAPAPAPPAPAPPPAAPAPPAVATAPPPAPAPSIPNAVGEFKPDAFPESESREGRERSGSASSASRSSVATTTTTTSGPAAELHKSSSDSVVATDRSGRHAPAARMCTQPINIPGSPQRQSSSSTTDDDEMLLIMPESRVVGRQGKSRHPVRRSNSSPEMSSSWKVAREPRDHDEDLALDPLEMILLPSVEPQSASVSMHASKKANKKSDMRVSCEAIPEEMCGTSPLACHPHLMTYKSDPGSGSECAGEGGADAPARAAHNQLQKTASDGSVSGSRGRPPAAPRARDELPPLARSKRSNTISVMSPTRRHRANNGQPPSSSMSNSSAHMSGAAPGSGAGVPAGGGAAAGVVGGGGGGLTPSFVFLQLYHNMSTYPITPPVPGESPTVLNPLAERPLRVSGPQHERTIKNLDLVPPLETYKIGILYVGPGQQDNEVLILKNEYGSVRYSEFLTQLGTLVSLEGTGEDDHNLFLNLEKGGKDGRYTYVWNDDIMQVLFHVATAMPSSPKDPTCNEKRKYIGNDFVSIVYNDSGAEFNIHTIKGQFNFCIVVVEPYEHGMNRVFIKTKDERIRTKFLSHLDSHVVCVSDANVALLARQVALHCALAAQISQSLNMGGARAYASNWLERLRAIKRLRARVAAERHERHAAARPAPYHAPYPAPALALRVAIDDFNDYT